MQIQGGDEISGKLYVVATPIGNLGDMTFRAVETLRKVGVIACEDTRVTGKLCAHYDIVTPRVAVHQHTRVERLGDIVAQIVAGEDVAIVSDAGTPGISDPGNQLVAAAVAAGVAVVPIPGASAIGALVSVSGIDMQRFVFLAYPPHKKGRQTFFDKVAQIVQEDGLPVIYYDSVYRVIKNLELLREIYPDAQIVLGRELTKMFEEIVRGDIDSILAHFAQNTSSKKSKIKGEFVLIVHK